MALSDADVQKQVNVLDFVTKDPHETVYACEVLLYSLGNE